MLWCWGLNGSGQLGLGDTTNRTIPVQVGAATTWASVTAGDQHTCATRNAGTLWCWGLNGSGQLGLGDKTNRTSPVQVGTATDWLSATGGLVHTCGRRTGKSVWCWGGDNNGQLGLGDNIDRDVPTQITGFRAQVVTGSQAQCTIVRNAMDDAFNEASTGICFDSVVTSVT
jgi:alpha-tubulin suppressor-like RCC1 family protein